MSASGPSGPLVFLPISLNICFGCSKELSHQDGSFEYPQHMFWLRNKKNNFGGLNSLTIKTPTKIWGRQHFQSLLLYKGFNSL